MSFAPFLQVFAAKVLAAEDAIGTKDLKLEDAASEHSEESERRRERRARGGESDQTVRTPAGQCPDWGGQ